MPVSVARHAGFCMGVKRAVDGAVKAAQEGKPIVSFGELAHNPEVIRRLNAMGISVIHEVEQARGKVVLIDFWATWCMPCKAEIPNIKRAYAAYKDRGFEVYSISLDRDKSRWLAEEPNLPWINVLDEAGVYADRFSVQSIPFTILIDREGRIVAKNVRGAELDDRLKALFD